ncbi:MAG TPA: hypothetical protein VGP72_00850 [Planctomycetota bacterium]|jgi:hypothetical protein
MISAALAWVYRQGRAEWKPILHYKAYDCWKDWSPRSERGRSLPPVEQLEYISVWGGMVEHYDAGYEQQPVQLVFGGLDIDRDDNPDVSNLPGTVARILPEAYVRISGGGFGAHVFLVWKEPLLCGSRSQAQALAQRMMSPFIERLHAGGVEHICSTVNALKIWSIDGWQRDVQMGELIDVDLDNLPALPRSSHGGRASGRAAVTLADCGPLVRRIIAALEIPVGNSGELPRQWNCHVVEAQQALKELVPFETCSAGTELQNPNAFLAISDRGIALLSGPDSIHKPLIAFDIDQ